MINLHSGRWLLELVGDQLKKNTINKKTLVPRGEGRGKDEPAEHRGFFKRVKLFCLVL